MNFKEAMQICNLIKKENGDVRFIGGCVRDALLEKEICDIDLATNLLPEEVENILSKNNIKFYSIGKDFGTITGIIGDKKIEITTLRKDLNCDGRHAQVSYTDSWKEDAERRDFTINAMSMDLDGEIHDYYSGVEDLRNKKVRFIGDAEKRICEDYLRILRFFRFSAYFNNIDQEGLEACNKFASNLKNISVNRIKLELSKIFLSQNAEYILPFMEIVLSQVFPLKENPNNFLKLFKITSIFKEKLNDLIFFASLILHCDKSNTLIDNFSFSNNEKSYLKLLINARITSWDYSSLKQSWCEYKTAFKEVVLLNLAAESLVPDEQLITNLEKLFSIEIKELPIRGRDILKLGIESGKNVGKLLNYANQIWYDQEFKITPKKLLEKIYDRL